MWDHAVINGTIVTDKAIYPGNIYIKDGKITEITSEKIDEPARETTDAVGKLGIPRIYRNPRPFQRWQTGHRRKGGLLHFIRSCCSGRRHHNV